MRKILALLLFGLCFAVDQGVLIISLENGLRDKTNDAVLNAGTIQTYKAGTTTAKATYTTVAKTVAAANPIVLDAYGRATAYALTDGAYKFVIKDSSSVTVDTWDNINFASVVNDINSMNIGVLDAKDATFTDITITGDAFGKGLSWDSSTANEAWSIKREASGLDFDYVGSLAFRVSRNGIDAQSLNVDRILEYTSAHGVSIDGLRVQDGALYADNLLENTSAHGVSIDGILVEDSSIYSGTIHLATGKHLDFPDGVLIGNNPGALAPNDSVVIGNQCGEYLTTDGNDNIFIGQHAGAVVATGDDNIFIGTGAGTAIITHNKNVLIGRDAGYTLIDDDSSVMLGYYAGRWETNSQKLYIDGLNRTNEATGRTNSIIYGVMNSTVANQTLALNAGVVNVTGIISANVAHSISVNVKETVQLGGVVTPAAEAGNMFYNSATNTMLYYNGSAWLKFGSSL